MAKVAKLVYVSMMTRVIVEDDAPESEILRLAKPTFFEQVQSELGEHIEDGGIVDDEECPYGTIEDSNE